MNNLNKDYKQITVIVNGEPKVLRYKKPKPTKVDDAHGYWNGLKIRDMSNEHIINVIKYLRANVEESKNRKIDILTFRLRKMIRQKKDKTKLDDEIDHIADMSDIEFLYKYSSSYRNLVDEAKKRNLI